ncbi:MAG: DUF3084 domain-containing protein [Candidatus Saganbacteria bacterium]|nr:DUF3084 domain-containing protein [Candidatus Saganbacteria bacterium]
MSFPFAVQLVLVLLVIGGAIAYIGNYVGKYIGKRRLTVFHLRPRHTAMTITVISGILIAFSTMLILLAVSQDARTAFLGLEKLKLQINEKTAELDAANRALRAKLNEQQALEAKLARARREVAVTRQGALVLRKGEVITLSLIQGGPERAKIEAGLDQILAGADAVLRGAGLKGKKPLVAVDPADFEQAVHDLTGENRSFVVKLLARRNTLWGEAVAAQFETLENKLIYYADQEIASGEIAARLTAPEAEQEVTRILALARRAAIEAGVLPDRSGSLGSLPYAQIVELAGKLKGSARPTGLRVVARKDIYAVGPLEIAFRTGAR